jgi:endonuclease/exonuclease/phosphatase family metal-dependent hydrolase
MSDCVSESKENYFTCYYNFQESVKCTNDYCFVSEDLSCNNLTITDPNEWEKIEGRTGRKWKGLSDHCPLIVEFEI